MTCPARDTLVSRVDGGLSPTQADAVTAHVAQCSRCQKDIRTLETLASTLQRTAVVGDGAFVSDVMGSVDSEAARRPVAIRLAPALSFAALSCAAVLLVVLPKNGGEPTARGQAITTDKGLGFEVFADPSKPQRALEPSAKVPANAPFTFVVYNRGHAPQYLMLFGRDATGEIHWFAPSYERPEDNPTGLAITPSPSGLLLPQGTELASPAIGPLTVVAMFSPSALLVHDVEALVTNKGLDALPQHFAGSHIETLTIELTKP